MPRPDGRKQLGTLLLMLLALGLAAYALINILHWQKGGGGGKVPDGLTVTRITLDQAPASVREAAGKLSTSRVGYVMPQGNLTYLIISTGYNGEAVDIAGARKAGNVISIDLRSGAAGGDRLILAVMKASVLDPRLVQFFLDGNAAGIPALINTDNLPLAALPDKGAMVLVSPVQNDLVPSGQIVVSGYARVFEGQFSVTVYSQGKGKMLGQEQKVMAATGAPNWGSFKVTVPYDSKGLSEGVVLVYDDQTGAKVAVPIRFK